MGLGVAAAVGIAAVSLRLAGHDSKNEEIVYRETKAVYGNLTVGITEEAAVEIGTLEQRFELDISALVDSDTTSASGGQAAADAMPGGIWRHGKRVLWLVQRGDTGVTEPVPRSGGRKDCGRAGGPGRGFALYPDDGECGGDP